MPSSVKRAFSPPLSTVSSAQGSLSPLQVKKVVLEGRSKPEGAAIKMFLKLSVAIDSVQPGSSIPLFAEDNIRIMDSIVHPLDDRSVPFYYSSTEQPLVHKTATALQLGPKSSRQYHTLFSTTNDSNHASSSRRGRESTSSHASASDRHVAQIDVNNYSVVLILPKEFPQRSRSNPAASPDSDGDDGPVKDPPSAWSARSARRSSSLFHKSYLHMMVGMIIYVPYVIRPPRGPFLVSIPIPRCLDNHLKMRISVNNLINNETRRVFDSASSGEDTSGWDFLTDPPVTHKVPARKGPYQQVDDDISDTPSAQITQGTEVIQGAFQSTDFLHIRWAPPMGKRPPNRGDDGLHRVNVPRAAGKMHCEVLGRDKQSIKLGILYEGTCYDLWHPGVAIILGMDISLDTKGRRVSWPEDETAGWAVTAGDAFAGLHSEAQYSQTTPASRQSSIGSAYGAVYLPLLAHNAEHNPMITPARNSASLLRAPLPNQQTPDYSFEASPTPTPGPSEAPSSTLGQDTRMSRNDVSPARAITMKINLTKFSRQARQEFPFRISGIILVDIEEEDFLSLPVFRIFGCVDNELSTFVSLQTVDTSIRIGEESSNTRRMVRVGEEIQCDKETGLFIDAIGSPSSVAAPTTSGDEGSPIAHRTSPRKRATARARARAELLDVSDASGPLRTEFPQEFPSVLAIVTPLTESGNINKHCVRVVIPMYSLDADTIQFALAMARDPITGKKKFQPTIDVLYASYAGHQVPVDVLPQPASSPTLSAADIGSESEVIGERQYVVVAHLEEIEADSGPVEIMYLVGEKETVPESTGSGKKGKGKAEMDMDVLLPCFQLPVAMYEVQVEYPMNSTPFVKYSTLPHQYTTSSQTVKLAHFRQPRGFFPALSLSLLASSSKRPKSRDTVISLASKSFTPLTLLLLLYLAITMSYEVREVRHTLHATIQSLEHGVPFFEAYWGDQRGRTTRSIPTIPIEFPSQKPTTWEKETVKPIPGDGPATPTINLADATTVTTPRRTSRANVGNALIPFPAVSFLSWKIPLPDDAKEILVKGFMKAWYFLRRVWNFPVDPDE